MKKPFLLLGVLTLTSFLRAQFLAEPLQNDLSFVPPVSVVIHDSSGVDPQLYFGFTTMDCHMLIGAQQNYGSSFQIVSASQPYPPRVFGCTDIRPDLPIFGGRSFMDFRIQPNNQYSVLLGLGTDSVPLFQGYLIFTQNTDGIYAITDTFTGTGHQIDGHSFIIDANGNYWHLFNLFRPYDMSYITGRAKDTAAIVMTTGVGIWNPVTETSVFEMDLWAEGLVPIDSIPVEFLMGEVLLDDGPIPVFDVTHPNSWYPMDTSKGCQVGILSDLLDGIKFINLCDTTVLRYGASLSDFTVLGTANHNLVKQHDFKKITSGIYAGYYTCFDNGDNEIYNQPSRVPILDFDFNLRTVRMVDEVVFPGIYSLMMGSVDFRDDYVLVNFGGSQAQVMAGGPNWLIYNWQTDQTVAEYRLPPVNFAYTVWFLNDKPVFPDVNCNSGNQLLIDSTLWSSPLWSDGHTTYSVVSPPDSVQCVTVKAGGVFRASSYFKNSADCNVTNIPSAPFETIEGLEIAPNPTSGIVLIKGKHERLELADLTGNIILIEREADQINLSAFPAGVYILTSFTSGKIARGKVIKL